MWSWPNVLQEVCTKFAAEWIVTESERYVPLIGHHPMICPTRPTAKIFKATAALSMELAQEDGVAPASTSCAGEPLVRRKGGDQW